MRGKKQEVASSGGLLASKSELIFRHLLELKVNGEGNKRRVRFWGVQGGTTEDGGASAGDFHSFYANSHVLIDSSNSGCIRDALADAEGTGADAAVLEVPPLQDSAAEDDAAVLLVINIAGIIGAGCDGAVLSQQLGVYLSQFVNEDDGVFIIWKMEKVAGEEDNVGAADSSSFPMIATPLLMELASTGIVAANFGDGIATNYFNPLEGFAMYFEKKSYSIRHPKLADLKQLLQIDADSWKEDLRYSSTIMKDFIVNKSDDIILMVNTNKVEGDEVVGAMFTQRTSNDLGLLDAEPWEVSVLNSSRVRGSSGTVKQLMRVSTRGGGRIASAYAGAGVVLRDFALVVAASQGINEVVAITRSRDFVANEQPSPGSDACYDSFLDEVRLGHRIDQGLNFHLSAGAALLRKTRKGWLPNDKQNNGYGVLVQYILGQGTSSVVKKSLGKNSAEFSTEEDMALLVEESVGKIVRTNVRGPRRRSLNFMGELGLDSLGINELANDLETKTGVNVSATTILRNPSILSLSSHLDRSTRSLMLGASEHTKDDDGISYIGLNLSNHPHETNGYHDSRPWMLGETEHTIDEDGSSCNGLNLSNHPHETNEYHHSESIIYRKSPISIVGMSCHFPGGVRCPKDLWEDICAGGNSSSTIPFQRWDVASMTAMSSLSEREKMQVSHGSFVNDTDSFDYSFFNISKAEAETMSVEQRMLLECSYLAFRDAGYGGDKMKGLNCGVFVGLWSDSSAGARDPMSKEPKSVFDVSGSASSIASGRISYVFDLSGPNAVYDTACSSSLVALDAALSALREGKCDMALVAGVNALSSSEVFESCARAGMLSPTGRCHTFDASADGYLRGEGCGAVLLVASKDAKPGSVYANILGTRVMSDGKSASITAPNGVAQEKLILKALETSGVNPRDVDYIEAHGTGTKLGDPIEVESLFNVFGASHTESRPLLVGSIKSNIGHLEGAAGIAGLIKSVLVLGNESAPPVAGLEVVNPLIQQIIGLNGSGSSIKFPIEVESIRLSPLNGERKLLVAGVSSFGYSGTIAHAIVQQAPLDMRRDVLQPELESLNNASVDENSYLKTMFLFTGQGSQYAGMGQTLYEENEVFRRAMDECEAIYKSLTKEGDSLLDIIFKLGSDNSLVTSSAQPALIALEYSLTQMWIANDVIPDVVLGHSVGEIAAACTAGAMSIETAMKMVFSRARVMNNLQSSDATMIAIRCDRKTAEEAMLSMLDEGEKNLIGVASVNGPNNIVLSGVRHVVEKLVKKMDKQGVYLDVAHSFHSPLMKSIEDDFRSELKTLDICNPLAISLASTVTGLVVEVGEVIELEHWVHQLASTVLFEDAFTAATLIGNGDVSGRSSLSSE